MARAHVEILYKIESNNTWQSLIDNNIKLLNIEENEIKINITKIPSGKSCLQAQHKSTRIGNQ